MANSRMTAGSEDCACATTSARSSRSTSDTRSGAPSSVAPRRGRPRRARRGAGRRRAADRLARDVQGDRHAEEGQPVGVVGRAVERVDVPDVVAARVARRPSSPTMAWPGKASPMTAVIAACERTSAEVTRFARASLRSTVSALAAHLHEHGAARPRAATATARRRHAPAPSRPARACSGPGRTAPARPRRSRGGAGGSRPRRPASIAHSTSWGRPPRASIAAPWAHSAATSASLSDGRVGAVGRHRALHDAPPAASSSTDHAALCETWRSCTAPARSATQRSGVTRPETTHSPSPQLASITIRPRSPDTGSTVNSTPEVRASTSSSTPTARSPPWAGSPWRRRYSTARGEYRLAQQRRTWTSTSSAPRMPR